MATVKFTTARQASGAKDVVETTNASGVSYGVEVSVNVDAGMSQREVQRQLQVIGEAIMQGPWPRA